VAINTSYVSMKFGAPAPPLTVEKIGHELMGNYVLPLEAIAMLLTAALIGAVIIAMKEPNGKGGAQ